MERRGKLSYLLALGFFTFLAAWGPAPCGFLAENELQLQEVPACRSFAPGQKLVTQRNVFHLK